MRGSADATVDQTSYISISVWINYMLSFSNLGHSAVDAK